MPSLKTILAIIKLQYMVCSLAGAPGNLVIHSIACKARNLSETLDSGIPWIDFLKSFLTLLRLRGITVLRSNLPYVAMMLSVRERLQDS